MTTNFLDRMRANASIVVSTENNKSTPSFEETDVIINIDQARTDEGAAVDTSGTVEDTLATAIGAQGEADAMSPAIAQGANDIAGLESARVVLARAKSEHGGIDMQAAPILKTTIDNCLRGINLSAQDINMPSTESFGGNASAFESTRSLEENVQSALMARRIVNLESIQIQAVAREDANELFGDAAEALLERASGLERVVANISGEPTSSEIEVGELAKVVGSKNGSVAVAASNLAAYVKNALVTGAAQYNTLGCALAEVEEPAPAAAEVPAEGTDANVDIDGVDAAANVTVNVDGQEAGDTPAAEVDDQNVATDAPAADPDKGTEKVSTEDNSVDKDTLVNDEGKETKIDKPADEDISTSDTPAEAAEGTQIATDLPKVSTESDDVSVSDVIENLSTDEDLPGDAVVEAEDEMLIDSDGEAEVDLTEATKTLNSNDVTISEGNYEGSTLPVLDQSSALLVVKSAREIAEATIAYKAIAAKRPQILEGVHGQLEEAASGSLPAEASNQLGTSCDFSAALYRTVSDAEARIMEHALSSARALLTYVSLSCKAYTDVPATENADVDANAATAAAGGEGEAPLGE